jgi:hypothetical protein
MTNFPDDLLYGNKALPSNLRLDDGNFLAVGWPIRLGPSPRLRGRSARQREGRPADPISVPD